MSGIACFVTSTSPNTLVSKIARHASAGITSSGRLSLSTPALFTSTRRPSGRCIVDGSFTSSRSTRIVPARRPRRRGRRRRPDRASSRPRRSRARASSIATARPIPRLAPVTTATPVASMRREHTSAPLVPSRRLDLHFTPAQERFRADARAWLTDRLDGPFAAVRGRGGPGDEHECFDERLGVGAGARPRRLDRPRLAGRVRRPRRDARRAGDLLRGVRARRRARAASASSAKACSARRSCTSAPTRRSAAFLPGILRGTEIWCQGYSEPNAGSDLANVQTRAELDGDEWVITGQKVWTSLAHWAQWIFVLARTESRRAEAQGPLVPARADGPARHRDPADRADHRALASSTRRSSTARAPPADNVVGEVDDGWRVAMGTLAFERGASTLGQQLAFEQELRTITELARANGRRRRSGAAPTPRRRVDHAARDALPRAAHAAGARARHRRRRPRRSTSCSGRRSTARSASSRSTCAARPEWRATDDALHGLFLYSRADTIYGGSNQIQRNVIGERALGLPKEPQ